MSVKSVQLGQVWRHDETGKLYLVTKLYREVFSEFAMLREADVSPTVGDITRVRISKTNEGAALPGYTFTQDEEF